MVTFRVNLHGPRGALMLGSVEFGCVCGAVSGWGALSQTAAPSHCSPQPRRARLLCWRPNEVNAEQERVLSLCGTER